MIVDPNLEALSEKIRKGEPVGFLEAIAAINYQEQLRTEREYNSFRNKAMRGFKRMFFWRKTK